MFLFLRLVIITIRALWAGRNHDPHMPISQTFHVLITDIDANMHLSNSRYPSFIDLVRVKFLIRTGLLKEARELGGMPVVGAIYTRFRRELKPFVKFTVKVELVYVSPRWFYLDYKFIRDGFVHCHSMEKWGVSMRGVGMVAPHKLLKQGPGLVDFPKPPAHVAKIMDAEDEMRVVVRKES